MEFSMMLSLGEPWRETQQPALCRLLRLPEGRFTQPPARSPWPVFARASPSPLSRLLHLASALPAPTWPPVLSRFSSLHSGYAGCWAGLGAVSDPLPHRQQVQMTLECLPSVSSCPALLSPCCAGEQLRRAEERGGPGHGPSDPILSSQASSSRTGLTLT